MRVRVLMPPLIGATLLTLAACATTSVTAPGLDDADAAPTPTVPLAPVTDLVTVAPTDPPTTTAVPTTTTIVETTTTVAETTTTAVVETTTTTTLPPGVVPVAAAAEPIVAVGTRSGADTAKAQWRLLELGFWVQNPDGEYGLTTRQAVMAFQKYYGLATDGVLGEETAGWLTAITERPRARADAGTLVEIDKAKQLLFFVVDGRTEWILNTSTGNGEEYEEEDKNTPGELIKGVSITPERAAQGQPRAPRRLVGRRSRRDLPAQVLQRWRRRPRLQQHPQLPGVARLRAGQRAGDGLDLGGQPDAEEHPRLGPRRRVKP